MANLDHLDLYQPFHVTPGPLPLCVTPRVEDSNQIHGAIFSLHLTGKEEKGRGGQYSMMNLQNNQLNTSSIKLYCGSHPQPPTSPIVFRNFTISRL